MTGRDGTRLEAAFEHHALFYEGDAGFLDAVVPFLAQGVDAGEPVLAIVSDRKIAMLRDRLGPRGACVRFVDMELMGANPARLIPAWRRFVDEDAAGAPARGIGEPVWAERSGPALHEAQRHEALIDLAFADLPALSLLCPYDMTRLSPAVLGEASRSHSHVRDSAGDVTSARVADGVVPDDVALAPAPRSARVVAIEAREDIAACVRALIAEEARACGLSPGRIEEAVVSVHELVANTLRHGGGRGVLRVWNDAGDLLCEVEDRGYIADPLVGQRRPSPEQLGGRGIWIANQLCDLVEIRTGPEGTTVRVHVHDGGGF